MGLTIINFLVAIDLYMNFFFLLHIFDHLVLSQAVYVVNF